MNSETRVLDTIFALSSGAGKAGVAIIRISGPKVTSILEVFCGIVSPIPNKLTLKSIRNPDSNFEIDRGLVAFFEAPKSFTGEDLAEFQVHGSRAVIHEITTALGSLTAVRPAEPGEFTRRAFENGRMDLTEVEGLADLIDSETIAQRRQALRQMEGELGALYNEWRDRLIRFLAYAEAEIDFPDEDLPDGILAAIWPDLQVLKIEIEDHLRDDRRGERLRDGFRIVILGEPNVGKSSLLNLLARRDVAIVSDEEGTTRDVLEAHLDLEGFPVTFLDTAGLREDAGSVEKEGIRRALVQAETADMCVLLGDSRNFPDPGVLVDHLKEGDLLVWNKADLIEKGSEPVGSSDAGPFVSSKTGAGVDDLLSLLSERVSSEIGLGEGPAVTRARHRTALSQALDHFRGLENLRSTGADSEAELIAEELRRAAMEMGRLTGRVDVDDLLDVIFRDFCIGK